MNALATITFRAEIPESVVEEVAGVADDGSDDWYESALGDLASAIKEDPSRFLEYVFDDPDVEVDA